MSFINARYVLSALLCAGCVFAADTDTANALAKGGTKLISEGKIEKGKDMMYKALANDENCGEALYELGKLLEAEGKNATAADFYNRAIVILGDKNDAPSITKKNDANSRLKKLNPYATRFTSAMAEYAAGLETIHKKIPDSMTRDEAQAHVDSLHLSKILTADQMPKIEKAAAPAKSSDEDGLGFSRDPRTGAMIRTPSAEKSVVPPDVERALKASGWKTITGTWKSKAPNIYEVTDGKLEADYKNGMMQVTVHKGGTGSVGMFVRNSYNEYASGLGSSWGDRYAAGFGWVVKSGTATGFMSTSGWGTSNGVAEPYFDRNETLPEAIPKNVFAVSVQDNLLETTINGAKSRKSNVKISQEGPFRIEIRGTMTIESPGARGR